MGTRFEEVSSLSALTNGRLNLSKAGSNPAAGVLKEKNMDYHYENDICGLCGNPGADKYPHPYYWPGEQGPGTKLVHSECEKRECQRAYHEFHRHVGDEGVIEFLSHIR